MSNYTLNLDNITKIFGRRLIFKNINHTFKSGGIYGISGHNGSGKSTLAKIITGVISPSNGKIVHLYNNKNITPEKLHNHLGFVSPYLVMYDEFSASENLQHISKVRGYRYDDDRAEMLLSEFNLFDRRNDLLKTYSSGMKQRMKFIFSLLHQPPLIVLDEPTSNLDDEGKNKVYEVIVRESENNLIIVASNEKADLSYCTEIIEIEKYKNNN